MKEDDIKPLIRQYILSECLPGEKPESLHDSTELIANRILDSLGTLKLVSYIEERFGITIKPHETGIEYLNTVDSIVRLVAGKVKVE